MTERSSPDIEQLADDLTAHFHKAIFSRETQAIVERAIEALRAVAATLPERVPVKLTESAHRLWMCMNGHDINDFYERAEFILRTSLDGLRVGPGNRATVKSLLVEHFEQIAKAAGDVAQPSREATTIQRPRHELGTLKPAGCERCGLPKNEGARYCIRCEWIYAHDGYTGPIE